MKNRGLDRAICPGCGEIYTRDQMAKAMRSAPYRWISCSCGYEYAGPHSRPLTVQEIIDGKTASGTYRAVALEKYAIALLEVYYGSHRCNCGELAEYEHLRDKRRKSKRDLARTAELEKQLERIYGPQTEEEKAREQDLKWISERLKESPGNGRRPTGIRDNNGRMICEGDLVRWDPDESDWTACLVNYLNLDGATAFRVKYSDERACFMYGPFSFDWMIRSLSRKPDFFILDEKEA